VLDPNTHHNYNVNRLQLVDFGEKKQLQLVDFPNMHVGAGGFLLGEIDLLEPMLSFANLMPP